MATRFYLPSTGAADVSPAFDAGWELTTNAIRRKIVTARISSAFGTIAETDAVAASPRDLLMYQGVSAPIGAQTITGTVAGQVRCQENLGANIDAEPQIKIYVVSNDGTTVRGTLLDFDANNTADAHEFALALTNRSFPRGGSAAVSSVAALNNDRIVIEVGARKTAASGSSRTATMDFGDNSASDLAVDESTTTQNNPWIEFSFTIAGPAAAGVTIALNGIASGEALGKPKLSLTARAIGVASASALGLPKLVLALRAVGVASAQALGLPRLALALRSIGVTSSSALGLPKLSVALRAMGVQTSEALGVPTIRVRLLSVGAASGEALGVPRLSLTSRLMGVGSGEALGSPKISLTVDLIGVLSSEALGRPLVFAQSTAPAAPGVPGAVYLSDLRTFVVAVSDLDRYGVTVADLETSAVTVDDLRRFGIKVSDVETETLGLNDS